MKKSLSIHILPILFLLTSGSIMSQVTISRQLIGTTGAYAEGASITLSSSVGETFVQSHFATNLILTEGFQQSEDSLVTYEVINESCNGGNNGSIFISDVKGCPAPYSVSITAVNTSTVVDEKALGTGSYNVDIIGSNGCTSSITVFVGLDSEDDCTLKFYSGFSPNGDGINDLWIIDNIELHVESKIQIFNRWGDEVWSGENYDNSEVVWSGFNNAGNEMTDATYFYVAQVGGQTYKGWVEITR